MDCLDENSAVAVAAGDPELVRRYEAHLEACEDCRRLVSLLAVADADERDTPRFFSGQQIGRFVLRRPAGVGGMGVIFEATDTILDRTVALKRIRVDDASERERAHAHMLRESRALACLNHPNVVTLYDVGQHGSELYIAMEFVDGTSLAEWLDTPRHAMAIVRMFVQAGRGLAAIHAAGLVHRDIKPSNILIGSDGRVRIADFGLVLDRRPDGSARSSSPTLAGTPAYMAPEVRAGAAATALADQWSFGAALREAIARGGPVRRAVSKRVALVVERAMADDPERRYASIEAMTRALQAVGRRSTLGVAVVVGTAAVLTAGTLWIRASTATDPCLDIETPVAAAWGPAQHDALARAFVPGPRGGTAALVAAATRAFDHEAESWRSLRKSVCVASNSHGRELAEQTTRQLACLERHLSLLHTTVDAAIHASPQHQVQATDAALQLPSVDECANVDELLKLEQLPPLPLRRAQLLALDQILDAALARYDASHDASVLAAPLAAAREVHDFHPLQARALELTAHLQRAHYDPAEVETLHRAMSEAQAAGDDMMQARLAISLLDSAVFAPMKPEQADWLASEAEARIVAIERRSPRSAKQLRYEWLGAHANLLVVRGTLDTAEDELRRSIALADELDGPSGYRSAGVAAELAMLEVKQGQHAEAVATIARALPVVESALPSGDPELAGIYLDAAYAYHFDGDYPRALGYANEATTRLQGTSNESSALEFRADVEAALGQWDAAEHTLERASAVAPAESAGRLQARRACVTQASALARAPSRLAAAGAVATCFFADHRAHAAVAALAPVIATLDGHPPTRTSVELRFTYAQALHHRGVAGDDARAREAAQRARSECARTPRCTLGTEIDQWLSHVGS